MQTVQLIELTTAVNVHVMLHRL